MKAWIENISLWANKCSQMWNWRSPKISRVWGYYRVLYQVPGTRVKELTVAPGQKLSMQRHANRSEYWLVTQGACVVYYMTPAGCVLTPPAELKAHDHYNVYQGDWHQLVNPHDVTCRIVEIQYGSACDETDIERANI